MSDSTVAPTPDGKATGVETSEGPDPGAVERDEAEDPASESIDRKPASLSGALSIAAGAFVVLLGVVFSPLAVVPGGLGLFCLGLAFTLADRRLADMGGAALLVATLVTGLGESEPATLLCAVGTVLAWDLSNNAIGLGEQLGRDAETTRPELVHAAGTLGVGLLTAGTSYVVYQSASGGQPVAAVFFLLLAVVALVSALRL